ncbi:MAG: hypothetical protein AAB873_03310, partial [Patescibacteria group bacterium]
DVEAEIRAAVESSTREMYTQQQLDDVVTNATKGLYTEQQLDAEVEKQLPLLQGAISFWAGDDRAGVAVTKEKVLSAIEHVEEGGRAIRSLAKQVVERMSAIPAPKQEPAIELLTQNDAFRGTLQYVSNSRYDPDKDKYEPQLYKDLAWRVREVVEDVLCVEQGVQKNALVQELGLQRSEIEEKKDRNGRVIDRKIKTLSKLWPREAPTPDSIKSTLRDARRMGTGLSRTLDRLLYAVEFKDGSGRNVRINEAITKRLKDFGFSGYEIPSDQLERLVEGARRMYKEKPPYVLVLDRPFPHRTGGSEPRDTSAGEPVSKIVYALRDEERKKRHQTAAQKLTQ